MRRNRDRLAHLRAVPVFSALDDSELALVDRLAETLDVPAGHVLMTEGAAGKEFYVLLEGTADVVRGTTTVASLGPGDHVGELALLDPEPRNATVTMTSDGTVLAVTQREFWQLLTDVPLLSRKVLKALARRLHAADKNEV